MTLQNDNRIEFSGLLNRNGKSKSHTVKSNVHRTYQFTHRDVTIQITIKSQSQHQKTTK